MEAKNESLSGPDIQEEEYDPTCSCQILSARAALFCPFGRTKASSGKRYWALKQNSKEMQNMFSSTCCNKCLNVSFFFSITAAILAAVVVLLAVLLMPQIVVSGPNSVCLYNNKIFSFKEMNDFYEYTDRKFVCINRLFIYDELKNFPISSWNLSYLMVSSAVLFFSILSIVAFWFKLKKILYFICAIFVLSFILGVFTSVGRLYAEWYFPYFSSITNPSWERVEFFREMTLKSLNTASENPLSKDAFFWKNAQLQWCCCGVNSYKDWKTAPEACKCNRHECQNRRRRNYYDASACDQKHALPLDHKNSTLIAGRGCLYEIVGKDSYNREVAAKAIVIVVLICSCLLFLPIFSLCLGFCFNSKEKLKERGLYSQHSDSYLILNEEIPNNVGAPQKESLDRA